MKTILALVIAVSLLGFLAFHKYSSVRCAKIKAQVEIEREKNDELRKKVRLMEQKMQQMQMEFMVHLDRNCRYEIEDRNQGN